MVRDRKIQAVLRMDQIVGLVTVPAWRKIIKYTVSILCGGDSVSLTSFALMR